MFAHSNQKKSFTASTSRGTSTTTLAAKWHCTGSSTTFLLFERGGSSTLLGRKVLQNLPGMREVISKHSLRYCEIFRFWGYISDTTTVPQTTHPCFSNYRRCSNNLVPLSLLMRKPCSRLGVYQKLRLIGPTVHGGAGFSLCGTGSLRASTRFRRYIEAFSTSHRRARQSKS